MAQGNEGRIKITTSKKVLSWDKVSKQEEALKTVKSNTRAGRRVVAAALQAQGGSYRERI